MDVIHQRVAGLDVHKETIVACVRIMADARVSRECRTFATTTAGLQDLLAWLTASGCSHVTMEATGVYWKPVWNILSDGDFELLVANAAHIKNVPGRKTDVNDATWIADLTACGLIRGSFVPDQAFQELRTLLRTRKQLTREQTRHVQRLQKTLEEANIKLDSLISDVMGLSGRRMIEAMIAGERNPQKLAALADRRIKASPKALYDALHGRLTDHHRFRLQLHLAQYDAVAAAIGAVDHEIEAAIDQMDETMKAGQAFFRSLIRLLSGIPGVSTLSAQTILAEITPDMTRFATAGHLVAWAGLCPGQNESAGKRKSSRLRKGAPWLKTTLVQCATSAVKKKDSYFKAQFQRLKSRRGPQKAICAVAAAMLTTIYHMLKDGTQFQDLGAHHFDRRPPEAKARHLVAQLTKLGYTVQLQPLAEAA
jgi:transposase